MIKKIGVICLSTMILALAVNYSSNRSVSAKSLNESSSENRSEEKVRRRNENDSSNDEILTVGDTTTTSKNIFDTESRVSKEEISVTLNNVIKGNEAKKIVNNYNNNSISKIPDLIDDSLEYIIIEYTTTLPKNIKLTKNGQTSNLGIEITFLNDENSKNSERNYIIRSINFKTTSNLQPGESGITKTVLTIPKDTKTFVVNLGDSPNERASFIIN